MQNVQYVAHYEHCHQYHNCALKVTVGAPISLRVFYWLALIPMHRLSHVGKTLLASMLVRMQTGLWAKFCQNSEMSLIYMRMHS